MTKFMRPKVSYPIKANPLCEIDYCGRNMTVEEFITAISTYVDTLNCQQDILLKLLKAADCPCCDGSGAYYDNYGSVCQCQWCDETKAIIAACKEKQW